ncbi:hypothetical protein IKF03_01620 [Candidatus Saccharibacteria bacterium]|nr:hypothetical protein [Candidatus Saccharibacteria bacterium]
MDGQEYLDQISRKNKPVKKSGGASSIFSSKFFIVGMIGVVGVVLMMILGMLVGGEKGGEKNTCLELKLHLENTSELIKEYQNSVRSSNLRSISASLYGLLSNTEREVTTYLVEKYKFKDNKNNYEKTVSKKILNAANSAKEELNTELFSAKINGILDRIYAHKMAYEISVFIAEENKLMNETKNDTLKASLLSSRQSLENLYTSFEDFSETKPGGQQP